MGLRIATKASEPLNFRSASLHVCAFAFTAIGIICGSFLSQVHAAESASTNFSAVAPIFEKHCLDCHASEDPEGKLVLENYEALLKGGESGPAVVPGHSTDSLLVKMIEGRIEKEG